MRLETIKMLIMECVPREPGRKTTFEALYSSVDSYSVELGYDLERCAFNRAVNTLNSEQCLVVFGASDIRPTQYGLNAYSD